MEYEFNPKKKLSNARYEFNVDEEIEKLQDKAIVPKKTAVYKDLINREKANCAEIQNTFQKDLIRIKYRVADTYVKLLKVGNTPQNYSSSSTLNLSADLQGLGPKFKLIITLDNVGQIPIHSCEICISYDTSIYNFVNEKLDSGLIMPHVPVKYSFSFENISENGSAGIVRITVIHKTKNTPLIQTAIKVPVSELEIL